MTKQWKDIWGAAALVAVVIVLGFAAIVLFTPADMSDANNVYHWPQWQYNLFLKGQASCKGEQYYDFLMARANKIWEANPKDMAFKDLNSVHIALKLPPKIPTELLPPQCSAQLKENPK